MDIKIRKEQSTLFISFNYGIFKSKNKTHHRDMLKNDFDTRVNSYTKKGLSKNLANELATSDLRIFSKLLSDIKEL